MMASPVMLTNMEAMSSLSLMLFSMPPTPNAVSKKPKKPKIAAVFDVIARSVV
jgi:hypothetical protein